MKGTVVIFGANGFLGRYLTRSFIRQGREVVAVARHRCGVDPESMFIEWDGRTRGPWELALEGAALVVNLAGRSVNCRYTEANGEEILESRVKSTRVIAEAIRAAQVPPLVWMNASTATWYRHAVDRPQCEWTGEVGKGFSVDVANAWEGSFFGEFVPGTTRKVVLRVGMVLANEPGTVHDVLGNLVRVGLGGAMAGGQQHVSWIHMEDFLSVIHWLEEQPLVDGVVNVTAPESPTNSELMRTFREVRAMPVGVPLAHWMLKVGAWLLRSEAELVTKSRWVEPRVLMDHGFRWRWQELAGALSDLEERRGLKRFFTIPSKRAVGARAWTGERTLRVS